MPSETRNDPARVARWYGRVAARYADEFGDELRAKPLDRALLDVFVDDVQQRGGGQVADLGTGSGHVARYLHDRGASVVGIDLSPEMIAEARVRHPAVAYEVGDLCRLAAPDAHFAGLVAFYAIVHLTRAELVPAFAEARRVLQPGGALLLGFHAGDDTLSPDEILGERVDIAWNMFPLEVVAAAVNAAELAVEMQLLRSAYPTEHPSARGYIMARATPRRY